MFMDGDEIHITEDDACFTCQHFRKGVACPLLEALQNQVVSIAMEFQVHPHCGFYIEFQRNLRVVQ